MDVLCEMRDAVGESPLWSAAEQCLYWVDIEGRTIRRFGWSTGHAQSWTCGERVGCIALAAGGGLIAAMETGLFRVRLLPGGAMETTLLAGVAHPREGMRFNDGRCDRAGRFWAGTMVRDMSLAAPAGRLYRYDEAGLSAPIVDELITPNGLAFSPDGRTMYLSDSHPSVQRIWAFDLDDEGRPGRRREFVDMNHHPGRPDGAAVDAEGCYWICANDAGLVHCFTPQGRLERSIAVPVSKPSMCAFGGPGMNLMFVTSIQPARPTAEEAPLAGAVFVLDPGVQGLAEAACRH